MDLTDIYGIVYLKKKEYTLFPVPHGNFSKVYQIPRHKASFNNKEIELTPSILVEHHELKLDINKRNNTKFTNSWKLKNSLLNGK